MSTEFASILVFAAAAAAVGAILVLALRTGRERPTHVWAWAIGLTLALLGTALNLTVLVTSSLAGGDGPMGWLLLGSLALVEATVLAFIRPRWAAAVFAATALAMPALVALVDLVATEPRPESIPAMVVLGFYSTRALLTALFLWLATRPTTGGRPPASRSPALRSGSAPNG